MIFNLKLIFLLSIGFYFPSSKIFGQNLVLNPSFENLVLCSDNIEIFSASHWNNPNTGTSDILSSCNYSIPNSISGFQYAKDGNCYAGMCLFEVNDYKEYIQGEFSQILTRNKKYKLTFFVSLADSISSVSIRTLGFYTSKDKIQKTENTHLPYLPQIVVDPTNKNLVKDWIPIEGFFIANGEEKYFTIGNFSPDSLSDTTAINEINNPALFYRMCYFYIDDVSVEEVKSELDLKIVSITNSLSSDFFSINYLTNIIPSLDVQLFDGSGRLIKELNIYENINISVIDLSPGIYYCRILNQNNVVLIDKIIRI